MSWDSSLTDRQADGSDVGDSSGIQQKQSRWKSMATMTVGSGEVGGEESEWRGKSCSLVKFSVR